MRHWLTLGLFALVPATGSTADPPAEWKLPEADGKKWAARVEKAVARKGWTVEVKGNEITVRRDKPVEMVRELPNAPFPGKPSPDGERTVRYVLRFAPKMTIDEYDKLAAVNATSDKEYDRLKQEVGVAHKFDDFSPRTDEEKKRVADFKAAVAKLPRHALPDLYTPDHSIYFLHPWDGSHPADEKVTAECDAVAGVLLRLFGMYSPSVAGNGPGKLGEYLPEPRK